MKIKLTHTILVPHALQVMTLIAVRLGRRTAAPAAASVGLLGLLQKTRPGYLISRSVMIRVIPTFVRAIIQLSECHQVVVLFRHQLALACRTLRLKQASASGARTFKIDYRFGAHSMAS